MNVTDTWKFFADTETGMEWPSSDCYKSDVFHGSEGSIYCNDKRIHMFVIDKLNFIGKIGGMDGVLKGAVNSDIIKMVFVQLMSYKGTEAVTGWTVTAYA